MRVELNAPDRELIAALARLADGPANIRKALNKEIKDAAKPVEDAMRRNILQIQSRGVRGGGGSQREAAGTTPSGRLPTHTGLRAVTARALQTKITYRGTGAGVRIRVDTSKMPSDQKNMPSKMNAGRVRHPIMGRRDGPWVDQTFTPRGWFDNATRTHGPQAISRIETAINAAVRELQ
jgi:hypothetical protein